MGKQTFIAVIKAFNRGGAGVFIPFDVKKVFGKARSKIKGTIDKHPYQTTTAVMGSKYLLGIRKEIRETIGKNIGDNVKVVMEIDTEERIIVVPDDFRKALDRDKEAKEIFSNFAYTHRKEYVRWIEDAKKPETRTNRILKAVEMISAGKKFS
jgi:hypothetical protein